MEESKGSAGGESSRVSPSLVSVGGRQRFTVELRPGETTIVSWKKLAKNWSKVDGPTSVPELPPNPHPALDPGLPPGQTAEDEAKDAPPASRFSAVIEKIERLYVGKHSSDEEDLNDVPDDDEYDTEDSFIDDTELDEYFQVDNSAIKHDGFFVNRGKLERINEPTSLPNQRPNKRRRKDIAKAHGVGDDVHVLSKHVKVGKKATGKSEPLVGKSITGPSDIMALPSPHHADMKFPNQMNSSVVCSKNKSTETKTSLDPTPSKVSNGDASLSLSVEKDIEKQKTGIAPSKYQGNKLEEEFSDVSEQRSHDKSSYAQCKSQPGALLNKVDELDESIRWRDKDGIRERPGLYVSDGMYSSQTLNAPLMRKKEVSSVRPKSTMLEKTIRELEKMVADSRRPALEAQDADISSQTVKRRLPREVKHKLAKVARLAQASYGKISKELVNRLMSILGHKMQLRTLKRNLQVMVNLGLLAKKERDDRFQRMREEVADLIRVRVPYILSKALEQQAEVSDDFHEMGNEGKEVIKRKFSMDDVLEDKICDIYDLFVEGLDEDAGPQVRKLYVELAQLWPIGFMDNHEIKRAICRAKDRKRALYGQHKEKIKRRKLLMSKTEENLLIPKTEYLGVETASDDIPGLTSLCTAVPNATAANASFRMLSSSVNGPVLERSKQEKVKGSSCNPNDTTRIIDTSTKKKVKRKPELELGEAHFRPEKAYGEERNKARKHQAAVAALAAPPPKPSLPLVAPPRSPPSPNFKQPS
ncbi:hypothetical protein U1Q18_012771 [Sarracenia purpurea var. burkii]